MIQAGYRVPMGARAPGTNNDSDSSTRVPVPGVSPGVCTREGMHSRVPGTRVPRSHPPRISQIRLNLKWPTIVPTRLTVVLVVVLRVLLTEVLTSCAGVTAVWHQQICTKTGQGQRVESRYHDVPWYVQREYYY